MGGHVQVRVCCDEWLAVVAVLMGGVGGGVDVQVRLRVCCDEWLAVVTVLMGEGGRHVQVRVLR